MYMMTGSHRCDLRSSALPDTRSSRALTSTHRPVHRGSRRSPDICDNTAFYILLSGLISDLLILMHVKYLDLKTLFKE